MPLPAGSRSTRKQTQSLLTSSGRSGMFAWADVLPFTSTLLAVSGQNVALMGGAVPRFFRQIAEHERSDKLGRALLERRDRVRVAIEGHLHARMAEPLRDDLRVNTSGEAEGRVCVTKVMQADLRQP